ncbi:CmcJ/NvfI family oxidoreductase [Oceanicoccus sagamiensis]|uniref:Methyltransferase n=1 Tax=Oceanicoccus sagamiensis TaxID=716816 RepID=A0A1X9NAR7_9GAMM|nr:CmcJ/NvfI family oxidoreductase [Oceanicoccus sagamiensis]ARN75140.1 hypothetical protein BST96_14055 [Oceanicoccus sagamiensis]
MVTATLRYLVPTDEKPIYHASAGGADAQMRIGAEFDDCDMEIADARQLSPAPTLDSYGFERRNHTTAVSDFYQLAGQQSLYEQELRDLVLAAVGGRDAIVFDHTLRSDSPDIREQRNTREAASVIHNDYTDASAERRLRELVDTAEADLYLQHRYAIINVWRAIKAPAYHSPMALSDARTLSPYDLVASERRAAERIGELELVIFNPEHRWYFFPALARNEVLLIKTFDSATDGRARRCVHTAFNNPQAPEDAPPRESIESRLLVFF